MRLGVKDGAVVEEMTELERRIRHGEGAVNGRLNGGTNEYKVRAVSSRH
jgi:hypothetical protein